MAVSSGVSVGPLLRRLGFSFQLAHQRPTGEPASSPWRTTRRTRRRTPAAQEAVPRVLRRPLLQLQLGVSDLNWRPLHSQQHSTRRSPSSSAGVRSSRWSTRMGETWCGVCTVVVAGVDRARRRTRPRLKEKIRQRSEGQTRLGRRASHQADEREGGQRQRAHTPRVGRAVRGEGGTRSWTLARSLNCLKWLTAPIRVQLAWPQEAIGSSTRAQSMHDDISRALAPIPGSLPFTLAWCNAPKRLMADRNADHDFGWLCWEPRAFGS